MLWVSSGTPVDVGGGGDGEVHRAPARLAAAGADRGGEASPFARDGGVDRQRLEGRLDHAEAQAAAGALVGVAGDEHAEVQLGEAAALIAPSSSPGSSAPISTDVSSSARI